MTPSPFAIEQNNTPATDQTVFSGDALRPAVVVPKTIEPADDMRAALRARAAVATEKAQVSFAEQKARAREVSAQAVEKANSPEETAARALRRSRDRDFGMDM